MHLIYTVMSWIQYLCVLTYCNEFYTTNSLRINKVLGKFLGSLNKIFHKGPLSEGQMKS